MNNLGIKILFIFAIAYGSFAQKSYYSRKLSGYGQQPPTLSVGGYGEQQRQVQVPELKQITPQMPPQQVSSGYGEQPRQMPPQQVSSGYGEQRQVQVPELKQITPQMPPQQVSSGYGEQPRQMHPTLVEQTYESPRMPESTSIQTYGGYDEKPRMRLEVVTACSGRPCLNDGICVDLGSSFQCKCPWGFTGAKCEICLTECASNPCPSNKKCKAIYGGGFECVCPADRVGLNCEIQNDLCASNPCLNNGICKPIEGGSYTCQCSRPFSGLSCENIWENPCTEEVLRSTDMLQFANPWNRNSYLICTDISVYHEMPCSTGTYFNENLHHCVPEGYTPPVCPSGYCKNDGDCLIDEENNKKCVCKKGFSGDLCEINIDECALGGHAACAGGICVDQVNGYYCSCSSGSIGLNCQQTIANPCTPENLSNGLHFFELPNVDGNTYVHCFYEFTFIVSKCSDNLFWHQELQTCTIERPLLKSGACLAFPCKNGGECQDTSSGYRCLCKTGYTGANCEEQIDFCLSNPCKNGGKCLSFAGGYTCVCPDKIIDECCCHGVMNPCPPKNKIQPGVNNYFAHLFPHRYFHCDFDGRAFARTCASGLKWKQEALSCLPDDFIIEDEQKPQASLPVVSQQSYGYSTQEKPMKPVQASAYGQKVESYGSFVQTTQSPPTMTQKVESYGSVVRPTQTRESYGSFVQTTQSPPTMTQKVESYGSVVRPTQTRESYGSFAAPTQQPREIISPKFSNYGQQQFKTGY